MWRNPRLAFAAIHRWPIPSPPDLARGIFPELVRVDGVASANGENPPLIYHGRGDGSEAHMAQVRAAFAGYRDTLPEHRRVLLNRFELLDIAVKVVRVGTWARPAP